MHRCERRHCRRDYVLRTQFSANTYRIPDAMGICMVPMDPVAGMVGLRLVDCLSAHWRRRTKGRDQFRSSAAHLGGAGVGVVTRLIWRKPKPLAELSRV